MTIELSIANISSTEDELEIVLKNAGDTLDADRQRFLREAGKSQYGNLLVFERYPKERILKGDLNALRKYPSGVYVLFKTEPNSKNKIKVFVGVAGISEEMIGILCTSKSINLKMDDINLLPTLASSLEKQNGNPPKSMSDWDLAVIIPEQKQQFFLFDTLISIFKEAEGFNLYKTLNSQVSHDLYKINSDYHYFRQNIIAKTMMYNSFLLLADPSFWASILSFAVSLYQVINTVKDKRNRSETEKAEKLEGKYTIPQKSNKINNKNKGDNNTILNVNGDINFDIIINVSAEHLDKNFSQELNPILREEKPSDNFGE